MLQCFKKVNWDETEAKKLKLKNKCFPSKVVEPQGLEVSCYQKSILLNE